MTIMIIFLICSAFSLKYTKTIVFKWVTDNILQIVSDNIKKFMKFIKLKV